MSLTNVDDELRSAAVTRISKSEKFKDLADLGEDDLYEQIFSHTARTVFPEDTHFRGLTDTDHTQDRISVGKKIFRRWSKTLQGFVCSPEGHDDGLRKAVVEAIVGKGGTATAVVAGALVSSFGLAPALAALVAALVLKLVIVPAGQQLCSAWEAFNTNGES